LRGTSSPCILDAVSVREDATPTAPAAWWRQVFEVLDEALELEPDERAAHVKRARDADHNIGAAAAAVLADAEDATFLESPGAEFAAPFLGDLPLYRATDGFQIGSYRILREIGHGGMGTVYLAERGDNQYQKRVAVKLLPAWSARNERLVRRFVDERQILAALDHPDIARLFDGGVTADGLPWFAMEYVDGIPIDRYCEERGLTIESRLELFCRVCAAVQYAHRNLVVHRDLKPANILVTTEGGVKLLDFGIAKLLGNDGIDAAASLTSTGERIMTPMYASPEQLRGDPISTASDVYALGLLLNELLTGRYPYRLTTRDPHEVARAILEQEPERPSVGVPAKLARLLRGDLDTIVLTAMQKDPARRYGTAEQLEADVRGHLAGLPLAAHPETRLSRARKFVRRHRFGVTTATGVALLLVAFGVVSTIQSIRIRGQAARITIERDRAEKVSGFLAGLFRTSDPYGGAGGGLTAREILDSGAVRIDRELADQPDARAQMLFEMGRAYFGLGVRDRARRFVETSLAIRRRATPEGRTEIARTLDFLGVVLREQGELDAAEQAYRNALRVRRELMGPAHRDVARTLDGLASVLRAAGRFHDADSISREAVALDEAAQPRNPLDLAESLDGLAQAVHERGNYAAAEPLYRRVLSLRQNALGATHPEVGRSFVRLAGALGSVGQKALADSLFRHGLGIERRVLGNDHPDVAADEAEHARLLHSGGSDREAESLYRHALTIARRKLPAVHPLTATILSDLGRLELDRGFPERAEPLVREGLAIRLAVLAPGHPHIAQAQELLGAVALARRRYMEAERHLLAARAGLRAAYGDADRRTLAELRRLVGLYEASAQPQQAAIYRTRLDDESRHPRSNSRSNTERTLETSVVAVLPFRIGGSEQELVDLRDVLQDLLAAKFTGEGSPRALDPAAILQALRRPATSREEDRALDASLKLARQLGAGWLLHGDVAGTPRRLSVHATLVEVPGGATQAEARVEGSADSLPHLTDRLTARLLAEVQSTREGEDLATLTGTSLPALRAYVAGRAAFRANRPAEAEDQFERSLFLDSTFVPAGLGLAVIENLWGPRRDFDERWKLDAVWRQRDRLSAADRALLVAYLGPRYPRPSTLAEMIASGEQATLTAPNRVETWYITGASLLRYGQLIGYTGWEARANDALRRVLALDSTHAPAADLLFMLAVGAGDYDAARRYAKLYLAHSPPPVSADFVRWRLAVALGDSAGLAVARRQFTEIPGSLNLQRIVMWSQEHGVAMNDGVRAAEINLHRAEGALARTIAMRRSVHMLLNRGRPGEASRLLATSERGLGLQGDVGAVEFRIYAALYWDGDKADAAVAARRLEAYLAGASASPLEIRDRNTASCALAHWRIAAADTGAARAALALMRRVAPAATSAFDATPVCVAAAEALLDPAGLERLDDRLRTVSTSRALLITVGNLIAARLYQARGDQRRALDIIRRRAGWVELLSTQLSEEGRLAALAGDRAGAIRAYRHYLALRTAPEPELQQRVEQVRAEMQRLERGLRP